MSNTPQRPTDSRPSSAESLRQRESADDKMIKALLNRAMKDVLAKQDETLLKVARTMVDTGQVKEKVSQKNLSDDELRSMLDQRPATDGLQNNRSISDTI